MLSRLLIILLIYRETVYYLDSNLIFKFRPDVDMDTKLKIHIDVTVATPCSSKLRLHSFLLSCTTSIFIAGIGADILDSTNQNVFSFGTLEEQDTWWELCPSQRAYFEYMQEMNAYLREQYHSLTVNKQIKILDIRYNRLISSSTGSDLQRHCSSWQSKYCLQFTRTYHQTK